MLSKLCIKNVALIESADLNFCDGLNILSGETGAGKSVILDSVNFVLGAKADRSMIRYGAEECIVKAEFILDETANAIEKLREMDIDTDGEIIISRKFTQEGKNSIKINGNTVSVGMLRKITDCLVDVHGQSEHFFLLQERNQLQVIDDVAGEALLVLKGELKEKLQEKSSIKKQIELLGGDEKERGRRLDLLKFQIDEIERAELLEGEEEQLLSRKNKINNIEKILSSSQEAFSLLGDENGVVENLRRALRVISFISKFDATYSEVYDKLENLALEAEDVTEILSDVCDNLEFDEEELQTIEERLDVWKTLKRKYGSSKAEIDDYYEKIKEEYSLISDCEGQFALLNKKNERLNEEIYRICLKITSLRKDCGKDFCQRVIEELKTLNIPRAQFDIAFNEYSELDVDKATYNGLDEICFMFSANAGEPMKALGKIISGGEMSRFMLAIKTQLSSVNEISTYIFDEIDAGISGKTAKVVGEKLAKISKTTQILAVSHLAQIAAMGDMGFLIEKQEKLEKTTTRVHTLDEEGRLQEIIRLLGGENNDEFALLHAKELLKSANEYKKTLN